MTPFQYFLLFVSIVFVFYAIFRVLRLIANLDPTL
jgi:hypothetical protein